MTNIEKYARDSPYFTAFKKYCREMKIPLSVYHLWEREWKGFEAAGKLYNPHCFLCGNPLNDCTCDDPVSIDQL